MWFRTFQHSAERGVKFTALLVCCNHPQKYTTSVVTSFDTHHFQSSHLSLVPYIDTPLFPLQLWTRGMFAPQYFRFNSSSCGSAVASVGFLRFCEEIPAPWIHWQDLSSSQCVVAGEERPCVMEPWTLSIALPVSHPAQASLFMSTCWYLHLLCTLCGFARKQNHSFHLLFFAPHPFKGTHTHSHTEFSSSVRGPHVTGKLSLTPPSPADEW